MPPRSLFLLAALAVASLSTTPACADFSEWKDRAGNSFKGEPAEILGPFALFHTPGDGGRRVLLDRLAPEDWSRFALEVAKQPAPAATFGATKSGLAAELNGALRAVRDHKLVPVDCANRPVPEVLVVLYAPGDRPSAWDLAFNFIPTYRRLRAAYGDRFETVLFGANTDANNHTFFATTADMPWLVTDYGSQRSMHTLARFAPGEGVRAVAFSRAGVPLASTTARNLSEIRRFVDEVTDLLYFADNDNPAGWPSRLRYLDTVRPQLFTGSEAPPVLIGSPLRRDVLRRKGVTSIEAEIEVGPDGRPTSATLVDGCGVPAELHAAITDGLLRGTRFSPAISSGHAVAGHYHFAMTVGPAPACSDADLAWVDGRARTNIPLDHWLLLRPIPVPEASFTSVQDVDDSGVNVLTPFEVSDERIAPTQQQNSFDDDWFEKDGAASVAPAAGKTLTIDGTEVRWEPALAREGFINMQTFGQPSEFCIGYAWTEFDVDQASDAWLAIGSDDGLKIWLNGEFVHSQWIRRNSKLDDEVVPLHLTAGKNRLLIKIQNRLIDWSFVARLRRR